MYLKNDLRKELRLKRLNIDNKQSADSLICNNIIHNDLYIKAEGILFYCANNEEINVDSCIENALALGKKVALPTCTDSNGNMNFYYINSLDDVKPGFFGIREPAVDDSRLVSDFKNHICIVPGIAFDKKGYRLGYGKGYYDRFLNSNEVYTIGICYSDLLIDKLPADKYDIAVNCIITGDSCFFV